MAPLLAALLQPCSPPARPTHYNPSALYSPAITHSTHLPLQPTTQPPTCTMKSYMRRSDLRPCVGRGSGWGGTGGRVDEASWQLPWGAIHQLQQLWHATRTASRQGPAPPAATDITAQAPSLPAAPSQRHLPTDPPTSGVLKLSSESQGRWQRLPPSTRARPPIPALPTHPRPVPTSGESKLSSDRSRPLAARRSPRVNAPRLYVACTGRYIDASQWQSATVACHTTVP